MGIMSGRRRRAQAEDKLSAEQLERAAKKGKKASKKAEPKAEPKAEKPKAEAPKKAE